MTAANLLHITLTVATLVLLVRAQSECPCIDARPILLRSTSLSSDKASISYNGHTYPISFGSDLCKAHDAGLGECADTAECQPGFCSQPWCYVDPANCASDTSQSDYFNDEFKGELFYSYRGCSGDASVWRQFVNEQRFHGHFSKAIRLVLLPSKPYVSLKPNPDPSLSFPFDKYEGLMIDMLNKMNEFRRKSTASCRYSTGGMQFEERDLAMSQHSDDSYTSSKWTHCTFMLRDDKADLCVSEFWTNLDRMKFALPTSPVVLTSYKLATQTVAVDEKKLSIEDVKNAFRPLTPGVWAATFVMLMMSAILLMVFEFQVEGSEFNGNGNPFSYSVKAMYMAIYSFWSAGPCIGAKTKAGRLLLLGWATFITLMIASYTANLTNFLVAKAGDLGIQSVDDILRLNKENPPAKACVYPGFEGVISRQYHK